MDILIVLLIVFFAFNMQKHFLQKHLSKTDVLINGNYFSILFLVHFLLFIVYKLYTLTSLSDSGYYYQMAQDADSWFALFEPGTLFIRFLTYPFSTLLGLSYDSCMLIFSFLGFQGILFFYLAARENISSLPIMWSGMTVLELLFLLPNMHFWTTSIGKGSVMLFALGLTFYGLSRFNRRYIHIAIGLFLVYMGRPHILFALFIGLIMGIFFARKALAWYIQLPIILASLVAVYLLSSDVVEFTGIDTLNVFESQKLTHRAAELSKSSAGVDITHYNQFMKLFTFFFRPLFVDAPGLLGIVTSFENAILLYMLFKILRYFGLVWKRSNGFVLTSFFVLILVSILLSQVSGNLGIAIRQKSQIIPLYFILYAYCVSLNNQRRQI